MTKQEEKPKIIKIFEDRPFLRWYQQPKIVLLLFALIIIISLFFFPNKISFGEKLSKTESMVIWANIVLCIALMVSVLTNVDVKERWKNLLSLAVLLYFIYLIYAYSATNWDLMRRQFFNFEKMRPCWKVLFDALGITLKIGFSCFIIVPVVGFIFGLLRSFDNPVFNVFINIYVTVFRSLPDTVQIVLVYFALPYIGIQLESTTAVIVALSLLYSAYATEVFRSGISAINKTQKEAAAVLGMTPLQTMMLVVMPQAIRVVLPPLTSLLVGILKSTSIASIAAAPEMMTRAKQLIGYTTSVTPLIAVSVIYFIIITPFVILSHKLEQQAKKFKK